MDARPSAPPRESPSRSSATATLVVRRRCATRSWRACARARSPHVTSAATSPGVTLVGGGPGDPDLISIAGRKALMEADVVVADRLAPRELLGELPPDVELIDVAKLPRGRSAQQAEINRLIVDRALAGKRVARFKGGDNFVFGRGFEEVIACREAGVAGDRHPRPHQPGRGPGGRRHPDHPPRHRPRVHRDLRPPPAGRPGVAHRLGRRRAAAGHAGADDGGAATRPRSPRRWSPEVGPPTPRSRSSATAPCRPSAPCWPRWARWPRT